MVSTQLIWWGSVILEVLILIFLYDHFIKKRKKKNNPVDFKEKENYERVSRILDDVKEKEKKKK
jgi:hypothetical protein